jgi:hypothetical protein
MTSLVMTEQSTELTISVQLHTRDAYWATLLYLFKVRRLVSVAVFVCGVAYVASLGYLVPAFIAASSIPLVFVLLWIQAAVSMRNPMMQSPIYHTFSPSGISSKFQGGHIALDWELVRSASETGKYVSIWAKGGLPMILPKSQVGEAELAALKNILQRHLKTGAKLSAPIGNN